MAKRNRAERPQPVKVEVITYGGSVFVDHTEVTPKRLAEIAIRRAPPSVARSAKKNAGCVSDLVEILESQVCVFRKVGGQIDGISIGTPREPKEFPIHTWDVIFVQGDTPTICEKSDRDLPPEFLPHVVNAFKRLNAIADGHTIHWVGGKSTLANVCTCKFSKWLSVAARGVVWCDWKKQGLKNAAIRDRWNAEYAEQAIDAGQKGYDLVKTSIKRANKKAALQLNSEACPTLSPVGP